MPAKELTRPCMDCKDAEAILTTRKRSLCSHCFKLFIQFKILRRMDGHKAPPKIQKEYLPSKLLLPCPLVSLPRRVAYQLHVLVIEPSTISPSNSSFDSNFEGLQKTFPTHIFTRLPFYSVFEYVPEMKELILEYAGPQFADDSSQSDEARLAAFRGSVSSATSKDDLDNVLLTRLVVAFAKQDACETILWGRGASLTWQVSDGMSPWGVQFEFPLRDINKPELQQYKSVCPELSNIVIPDQPIPDNILTKNLSIDELMMRYVETQGAKYPGVMANVSRTANKLQAAGSDDPASCALCGSLVGNVKGNTGITVASQFGESQGSQFCYGCSRSRPEIKS
ncbi:Thiouridylase cytoplasmic subunit 2 [Penicillium atrosanguineum]|nr:Thiouridylase cytoplasmic subunit 2 [Penicillium atrosanguineum]